jgi:peptide/nickel transport system substrate-binding protein
MTGSRRARGIQCLWRRARWVGVALALLTTSVVGVAQSAAASRSNDGSGTLTWGLDLSAAFIGQFGFDPTQSLSPATEDPWLLAVYDSLLRPSPDGKLVPGLAQAATITSSESLNIRLYPNIKFTDGTPLNAAAVKSGIQRNMNAPNKGQFSADLYDISAMDVTSPTSLTIHFSQPVAPAFYPLLASPETFIVSPRAAANPSVNLNATPVGAGPFMVKQFVPNQRIVLVKNPKYFQASSIKLHEINIVNVPNGPQQVNALASSEVDTSQVPVSDLPTVRNGSYHVQTVPSPGAMIWLPVCKSSGPLSNVKVRQALSFAIDRPALSKAVLYDTGKPQWALWPPGNALAPKSLNNDYAYNPKKAKKLLDQAGYSKGFSTSILLLPDFPELTATAQILQQEWKTIGVSLSIDQSSDFVTDLYQRHVAPLGLIPEMPSGATGLELLNRQFVPGTIGDLCGYNNPALTQISNQLNSTSPGSSQFADLWNRAQQIVAKQALGIFVVSVPYIEVSDAKVRGNSWLPSTFYPLLDYWHVYVK